MSTWSSTPPIAATAMRLRELVGALRSEPTWLTCWAFSTAELPRGDRALAADSETSSPRCCPELDDGVREEVLENGRIRPPWPEALEELDSDDAAGIVDDLGEDQRAPCWRPCRTPNGASLESGLGYEDDTAGRLMQREVMAAPQFWTVGHAIDHVRQAGRRPARAVLRHLCRRSRHSGRSAAPISQGCCAPSVSRRLAEMMEPVTDITVDMDQEEVAYIFDKYHLISRPGDRRGRSAGRPDHRR
jgi:magnesium transporter